MPISKTQIDRLGKRLKGDSYPEEDLRLLEDYRRSFGEAYEAVIQTIRQRGESPTGRLAKSTRSIIEKLRRESLRLSQMQDIAGCRIVVVDVLKQDQLVAALRTRQREQERLRLWSEISNLLSGAIPWLDERRSKG